MTGIVCNTDQDRMKVVGQLRRSVLVSSVAGSGKTDMLVQRFCRIIERGEAGVDEILVVAASDRAARDIRRRIRERMTFLFGNQGQRNLAYSPVTTVRGLCMRILRENALEAGVDPHFGVMDEIRRGALLGRLAEETLEAHRDMAELSRFVAELGRDAARDILVFCFRRMRAFGVEPSDIQPVRSSDPLAFLQTLERCLNELVSLDDPSCESLQVVIERVKSAMPDALSTARRLMSLEPGAEFDWVAYRRLRRYRLRIRAPRSSSPAVKQQIRTTRGVLDGLLAACLDAPGESRTRLILLLACDLHRRYQAARDRLGLLDGDDLSARAAGILRERDGQPGRVALQYRNIFKHVLISDLQDINPVQKSILDAVCRSGSVFAVQDPGQRVTEFIYGSSGPDDRRYAWDRGVNVSGQGNYRSRPEIVRFINQFCSTVWHEDSRASVDALIPLADFSPKAEPDVELHILPRISGGRTDREIERRSRNEARSVASRILELTGRDGSNPLLLTADGRQGEPVSLQDIAVLSRSSLELRVYEQVLEEHGIEVFAASGREFCETPEVSGVLNLFRVVADPGDDIGLREVLLSPFVGLSQDVMDCLVSAEGGLSHAIEHPGEVAELGASECERILAFNRLLHTLIGMRAAHSPLEILETALTSSGFLSEVLSMPDARRRWANIHRLREMLRNLSGGLADAINSIANLHRIPDTTSDGVQRSVYLSTIHRARGASWPVVFLVGVSGNPDQEPGSLLLDREWGMASQVWDRAADAPRSPLSYLELAEHLRDREMSESKRLLYTALTRAEEHLVLVGSGDLRGQHRSTYRETNSWMGWLEKAFDLGPGTPAGIRNHGGCRFAIHFVTPAREIQRTPASVNAGSVDVPDTLLRAPVSTPIQISRISVSGLLDYLDCPAGYRLKYVIGFPHSSDEPPDDVEESPLSGRGLGNVVHDLLAEIDFGADAGSQIESRLSTMPVVVSEQVRPLMERFVFGRWCREMTYAERLLRESAFELPVLGKLLVGRMDAIYLGADGWTVLDYKTGAAEDRERYELQVGIYAYVVNRLLGQMPARAVLLMLSLGEEWVKDTRDGVAADKAQSRIEEVISCIDAGVFDPRPGSACRWCDAGKLGRCEHHCR